MVRRTHKTLLREHKRRRRSKQFRKRSIYLSLAIVVFVSAFIFGISDRFRIKTIEYVGIKRAPEEEIKKLITASLFQKTLFVPRNIIWFPHEGNIKNMLTTTFPNIRDVTLDRGYPDTIQIMINEYDPWGVLCRGEPPECFWIDQRGYAFEPAPDFTGVIVPKIRDERDIPITLGKQELDENFMTLVTYFNGHAVDNDALQSLQFTIDRKDETLRVETRNGWDILLFADTDPETAYRNLTLALDGEIKNRTGELEYIDLRFGNRLFYKFRE